jgi:hypothetical protein
MAVIHAFWQIHEGSMLVEGAVGLFVNEKTAMNIAAIDLVKPLRTLLVDLGFDAASIECHAFVPLGVNVGTLGMAVADIVGELVNADLIALGLALDTDNESSKCGEHNRNKTRHDA